MPHYGLIILAAGSSSRLGKPKQLLEYNEKNLVTHVVDIALQVRHVYPAIVLGANHEKIEPELLPKDITIITNQHWQQGMSSSISVGLKEMLQVHPDISGCIFAVCDQPFINVALLDALIETHGRLGKGIVAAAYAGTVGTPALFGKAYFEGLLHLKQHDGAKKLLQQHLNDVASVPFNRGEVDIDTREDYERLIRL